MRNADHLEEVMEAVNSELGRALLQSYREMVSSNDVTSKDYAIRLKEIIEESITQGANDASPSIVHN